MLRKVISKYSLTALLMTLGLCLVFFDFLSKAYIYHLFPFKEVCLGQRCMGIPVFSDFMGIDFAVSLTFNRGAAWGVFANFQVILLLLRMLMIVGLLLYLFLGNQNRMARVPLVLIVSGAIGNVIDFFLYGFVVDFLLFNFWGYDFPVFNLADTWITIGVTWLFLVSLFQRRKYA